MTKNIRFVSTYRNYDGKKKYNNNNNNKVTHYKITLYVV